MAYETLLLERGDGHAVVTLNRPPANTISAQLVHELEAAVDDLVRDDAVRAIVLTGAGDRIFCGGADLSGAFSGARTSSTRSSGAGRRSSGGSSGCRSR
jgi:enoyl-CoA hydratase/carnithine racemase